MADFSNTNIQPLNTSQPVQQPVGGVDIGSATRGIGQGLDNLFTNITKSGKEQAKLDLAQQTGQALSSFIREQTKIADAVAQGSISSKEGDIRWRANLNAAVAANPILYDEIVKAQGNIASTTGIGKIVTEGTDEEQLKQSMIKQAAADGFIPVNGDTEKGVRDWQNYKSAINQLEMQAKEVALTNSKLTTQSSKLGIESAKLDLQIRQNRLKSQSAIGNFAVSYTPYVINKMDELEKKLSTGEIDKTTAIRLANDEIARIDATVSALGADAGSEYSNFMATPVKELINNFKGFADGSIDNKIYKNQVENITARAQLNILGDPKAASTIALSSMMKNADVMLIPQINEIVMKHIDTNSTLDGKSSDLLSSNPEDVSNINSYLSTLKSSMTKLTSGAPINGDKNALENEVKNNVSNVLNGINAYAASTSNPKEYNAVTDFFADPAFGSYMMKNGGQLPNVDAAKVSSVIEENYANKVLPLIKTELTNSTIGIIPQNRMQGSRQKPTTNFIEPFFNGSGVVFRGNTVSGSDRAIPSTIDSKVADLNKNVAPILNKLIRMSAHLTGTVDYRSVWENEYLPRLFPEPTTDQAVQ